MGMRLLRLLLALTLREPVLQLLHVDAAVNLAPNDEWALAPSAKPD
eukprot:SAG11_NODE_23911_length_381_cov_0.914894_1_plen_45_part_01